MKLSFQSVTILALVVGVTLCSGCAFRWPKLISETNQTTETAIATTIETTAAPTTTKATTIPTSTLTTVAPTAAVPTTAEPTTVAPTTAAPTTAAPTTAAPTTKQTAATPTTTVPPTTAAPTTAATTTAAPTAWIEVHGTSITYDDSMNYRIEKGYESIPRDSTLDALAQARAEELAKLGELNHNNMPNSANWEGLSTTINAGRGLYAHCGDDFAATAIGIGAATYHRADGTTYSVCCMLLRK